MVLDALGSETRRRIFEMIRAAPRGVSDIAARLPVSQPAVSQHLRILRDARLVDVERRGRRRIYHARPEGLEPLRSYLAAFWDEALGAFAESFEHE